MDSFPNKLYYVKDELALLNMRWYLTHLLKVHLCWFNKRNNKRVLFVDCDTLFHKVLISQFIKVNWPLSHEKINTKGLGIAKKQFFIS
jgi:hypothetical protein